MVGQPHLRILVHHALDLPKVEMSQRHLVKVRGGALADGAILFEFIIFFNGDYVSYALPARGTVAAYDTDVHCEDTRTTGD